MSEESEQIAKRIILRKRILKEMMSLVEKEKLKLREKRSEDYWIGWNDCLATLRIKIKEMIR